MRAPAVACVVGLAGTLLLAACAQGDASLPLTVAEQRAIIRVDSARGDRAALATLPPALQRVLRVEPYLTDEYLASGNGGECVVLDPVQATPGGGFGFSTAAELRRVRATLPDSSALLVRVRSDASGAGLEHVELTRDPADGEPVGFIWDAASDVTIEARWPAGEVERAPQPRGGPVPRALRALGRLAQALTCTPESSGAGTDATTSGDTLAAPR